MQAAMRAFQDFVDDLRDVSDEAQLRVVMNRAAQALQLPVFAYLGMGDGTRPAQKPLIIGSYSTGWVDHYVEARYDRFDPVLRTANTDLLPFQWGGSNYVKVLSRDQQQIFSESRQFGIHHGFTVPIHDGLGRVATLNFATDEKFSSFALNVRENGPLLHLMGIYFHSHVRHMLQGIATPGRPRLSPRETQCLQWFARGKTSYDIAEILGISRRTVIFHLENAKAKLGVVTLQQALVEAMMRGFILR